MAYRPALLLPFILCFPGSDAAALELDTLLPADIPGYGTLPAISILSRTQPEYSSQDIEISGVSLDPAIDTAAGYNTKPNGVANGSSVLSFDPSLLVQDRQLGLGAYAAGAFVNYPSSAEQNATGYTLALGERALLPRETLSLAAAAINAQETTLGLNTIAFSRPVDVTVKDIRGGDKIVLGMLTLTPEFSASNYQFSGFQSQNRTDYRQSLTAQFTPDGPAHVVTFLHATESVYLQPNYDANTYEALAGVADEASGLWEARFLAGAAMRRAAIGGPLVAPVLEGSLNWMPGELDSLSFDLAREIDDPEQESADGYTLTEADISIAHEYLRNVIITGSVKASRAVYFNSPLVETLFNVATAINWHLNRAWTVNATYAFNDRQANILGAVNEHALSLGVTWTP